MENTREREYNGESKYRYKYSNRNHKGIEELVTGERTDFHTSC